MEFLYTVNYIILAAFFSLFLMEVGIGMLSILNYTGHRKDIRRYLLPIWGIDGTFSVFYIINTIATYPMLVGIIYLYAIPVLIGSIFFLLRSAFISYSEYIGDIKDERKYMQVYGFATIVMAFIAISVFSSGVSGLGINVSQSSIDILYLLFNPFNIAIFVSCALISLFISISYFKVKKLSLESYLFLPAAMVIVVFALYLYVPYMFASLVQNYYVVLISVLLMGVTLLLKKIKSNITSYFAAFWLFVSVNLFGMLQYPYLLGGSYSFLNYFTNSASAGYLILITIAGGILLIIALAIFMYVDYIKKVNAPGY